MASENKERKCVMDELTNINNKLDNHDKVIAKIEKELAVNSNLTERCVITMEKLNDTFLSVQLNLRDISNEMKNSNENTIELKDTVKKVEGKVTSLEEKVDMIEDKNKIDIGLAFKNNIGKIIIFILMVLLAYPELSNIFLKVFK